MKQPATSGSFYFNYKGPFSIVLLALVDADYKLIYVDIGCNGRASDGGVYKNSSLAIALEENHLNIPKDRTLDNGETSLPFVVVADDASPLKDYLMKPYAQRGLTKEQRLYTYHLSRARCIVENAFGILSNRFCVFLWPIMVSPENAEKMVLASCALHNYLRCKNSAWYTPTGSFGSDLLGTGKVVAGEWRNCEPTGITSLTQQGSNRYSNEAKDVQEGFSGYFNTTGAVAWQDTFALVNQTDRLPSS